MAISIKNRDVVNFNAPSSTGKPKADQYLDFNDDSGETVASLFVPASGAMPTFTVDNAPVGGVQTVYSSTVTLTNAQIKALPTTYIEIVPPTADPTKTLCFVSGFISLDTTAAQYASVDNSCVVVFVYQAAAELTPLECSVVGKGAGGFNSGGAVRWALGGGASFPGTTDLLGYNVSNFGSDSTPGAVEDVAIKLAVYNGQDFTSGHASNSLKATVLYSIVDI